MTTTEPNYPALSLLLGAYFHPDWDLDHPDEDAVIASYCTDAADQARRLPLEVADLLDRYPDPIDLRARLVAANGIYLPDGPDGTVRSWVEELARRTQAHLAHDRPGSTTHREDRGPSVG